MKTSESQSESEGMAFLIFSVPLLMSLEPYITQYDNFKNLLHWVRLCKNS